MTSLTLNIEFGGGLELLFGGQRSHKLSIPKTVPSDNSPPPPPTTTDATPDTKPTDITYLLHHLRRNLLQDRPELFMEKDSVRPGILVLVNDTDWELEGEGDYQLKDGDEIVFISTLHGG
ncbi:hypothetical protein ONZ45_g11474 [Pleurotus djamor]|nr:hypothetical protein ONZ45_g11474 [Pleurotus djamor]